MKKIILCLSLVTLLFSCSNEEVESKETSLTSIEQKKIELIKNNPDLLNSKKYSKIEILNISTNKMGIFYYEAQNGVASKVHVTRGLHYGGGDCAIWGTSYYDDVSGDFIFFPASPATQALMNVCGLSNVAKIKI